MPHGPALRQRLARQRPDLVITDYRLKDKETGFDIIESLRDLFALDLPALIVTGDTEPTLVRSMAERGIVVLYKPLQMDALQIFIKNATEPRSS